jgi:hypothetical protein
MQESLVEQIECLLPLLFKHEGAQPVVAAAREAADQLMSLLDVIVESECERAS